MGELTAQLRDVAHYLSSRTAVEQGGVISGDNPTHYNKTDPFRLWIIQVVIIVAMTQILAIILGKVRQPRVIAEVIGGVLLGPTVMGRIPGFQQAIFPDEAKPLLVLTSTIGLLLFLFLVGLEIDTRILKRNLKASSLISVAGLVIPLGLGAALGVGVYKEFINPSVNFGYFILFTSVAIGITAFPVLCRILTELKLLETTVGVVTLSAGIGNDVVGWILLALTVALVNASTGLTALYVLLASVGFVILLLLPGKWAYMWLCRRTGSLEQGTPTTSMMTVTLLVVFISAFFTDIIGVHAIFGGFLAGLIIPHENGYAISLVEKLEDLVAIIFLPIASYFTLSGLNTNLGLLDTGASWGYIVIICLVAFTSKFFACGGVAYASGFNWRESGAIGALMSCKGLVELIVLNIGLAAGILDQRTFSMFVVHALILTIITTPLTLWFYPPEHRSPQRDEASRWGPKDEETPPRKSIGGDNNEIKTRFALVLDKIEQLPAVMTLSQLLQSTTPTVTSSSLSSIDEKAKASPSTPPPPPQITLNALRLIELTTRTSAVLRSQEAESLIYNDPVVSVFRTFGHLNRLIVSAALSVVNYDEFPRAIFKHATDSDSQMVILPWSRGATSVQEGEATGSSSGAARNPFDGIFHKTTTQDQTSSVVYSEFIRNVFLNSPRDVALFVDRGLNGQNGSSSSPEHHLFLAFFGGPDDRLALSFLVQLCANTSVTATVVRVEKTEDLTPVSTTDVKPVAATSAALMTTTGADTVYGQNNTQTRLASDTADNLIWDRFVRPTDKSNSSALSRITFSTQSTSKPLHAITEMVNDRVVPEASGKTVIILVGRSRRMAVDSHKAELTTLIADKGSSTSSSVPRTLGDVGAAFVASNTQASLLIFQAAADAE